MKSFNLSTSLFLFALLPSLISASPLIARQSTATPTPINGYSQYVNPATYAEAAYCNQQTGNTVNGAQVVGNWGNGDSVPYAYVAYNQADNQIIVSHEGTNPTKFKSLLDDAKFLFANQLSPLLVGCLADGTDLHDGFQTAWEATASDILNAVQVQLNAHPGANVLVTGHSLGAAIASLDYAYLTCQLQGTSVSSIVFGQPRTGNQVYANSMPSYTHIVNGKDPIPHLPPVAPSYTFNGYWHAPGEVWINPANGYAAVNCPGEENQNCSDSIPFNETDILDHIGLYFGVLLDGTLGC